MSHLNLEDSCSKQMYSWAVLTSCTKKQKR